MVDYANELIPNYMSIVQNSIVSAIQGDHGNVHRTPRTKGSVLKISPVMSQYWCFSLEFMIERLLYYDEIKDCEILNEVGRRIINYRDDLLNVKRSEAEKVENELNSLFENRDEA